MRPSERMQNLRQNLGGMSEIGVHLECSLALVEAIERTQRDGFTADVRDFHEKFGLLPKEPVSQELNPELAKQRVAHLKEELDEYIRAKTLSDKLDALVDLVYVALGTACMHGFDFDEAWRRVHAANMRKIRVEKGEKQGIQKPDGWRGPDLKDLTGEENAVPARESETGRSRDIPRPATVGDKLPQATPSRPGSSAEVRNRDVPDTPGDGVGRDMLPF